MTNLQSWILYEPECANFVNPCYASFEFELSPFFRCLRVRFRFQSSVPVSVGLELSSGGNISGHPGDNQVAEPLHHFFHRCMSHAHTQIRLERSFHIALREDLLRLGGSVSDRNAGWEIVHHCEDRLYGTRAKGFEQKLGILQVSRAQAEHDDLHRILHDLIRHKRCLRPCCSDHPRRRGIEETHHTIPKSF